MVKKNPENSCNEKECSNESSDIIIKPIDKWDGSAVKNHLDDYVKCFFTQTYPYQENFILIDLRLAISLIAVGIAVFAMIWDHLNPFPKSRPMLLICVIAYFVFMALLTLYTTLIEKGIFLKASNGNKSLVVSSYMKRFDDIYQLIIELKNKGSKPVETQLEDSVAKWFDEEGYFLEQVFEEDLRRCFQKISSKKSN